MKVITAPAPLKITKPAIFLAGSIAQDKAVKWQKKSLPLPKN